MDAVAQYRRILGRGVPVEQLRPSIERRLGAGGVALVLGDGPAGPAESPAQLPAPAPPALKDCVHLGPALPGLPGNCRTKVRDCSVYGACTYCPSDRADHHCTDGAGHPDCPAYEE